MIGEMKAETIVADMLHGSAVTNPGLKAFMQSLARGRMDEHEALAVLEFSPRLAECLMQGLSGIYGTVTPPYLVKLARNGQVNGGALSRAMF